jgi:hypothetical protein
MPRGRFAGIPPKKSRNHGLAFADTLVPTIRLVRSAFAGTQCQLFASPPPMPSILYPKNAYFNTYDPPHSTKSRALLATLRQFTPAAALSLHLIKYYAAATLSL